MSGKATLTDAETKALTKILSDAGKLFNKIDRHTLNGIAENDELLLRTKTFMNTKVRAGEKITNTTKLTNELVDYLLDYFGKEDEKRKTPRGKAGVSARKTEVMKYFQKTDKRKIKLIFDLMNLIVEAKLLIIKKMDQASTINTLLKTKAGYEVTGEEGFVAIDKYEKNAVKLVDRLQFSKANFSDQYMKGWQKMSALDELKNLLREAAPHYIPKEVVEESVEAEIKQLSEKDSVQMTADLLNKSNSSNNIPAAPQDIESQRWNDPLTKQVTGGFVTKKEMNDSYGLFLQRIQQQMSNHVRWR